MDKRSVVELPRPNLRTISITLVGDAPLVCHKWSEKAKKQMRDKHQKKASAGREVRNPTQEFKDSLYVIGPNRYGFPAIAFKSAAVTACTSAGGAITKVSARQAFHIDGELIEVEGSKPRMREDMVRVGMGGTDLRYRGEFWPWRVTLSVRYNANVLSDEQILNLFNTAGFGVGVGEFRPEKNGSWGLFHVATDADIPARKSTRKKRRAK